MSPGGEEKALDLLIPFLKRVAAKTPNGKPCVARIGEDRAGHYVKIMHNGIGHGMVSAIGENWK
ncbi:hypothetical protein B0O99DRAFT_625755 [Bisporella sp. PMI_857]|nr:hypothetical protein B0O99DRAFT_625755 [Bisporella sp. PMI_857]